MFKKIPLWIFPVILGMLGFWLFTGGSILVPTNISWLMDGGDPAQHWLGWQFFRDTPLWQWPLGANPSWGGELSTSIVYTDSIPIFAFFFRLFQDFLPERFQYFGLWIFSCFVLQALFSWKLLSFFTKSRLLPILGSAFFVLAPPFLCRLSGHYALMGHWLLLAGLVFYFSNKFSFAKWLLCLFVAALVHPYIFVMCLAIWCGDLGQRVVTKEFSGAKVAKVFLLSSCALFFVMWGVGYFSTFKDVSNVVGFGIYRMNLLALFDPHHLWSYVLGNMSLNKGGGEYEGFNYLGLSMLSLFLAAVFFFFRKRQYKVKIQGKLIPILVVAGLLFVFALSHRITFGPFYIIRYELGGWFDSLGSTFRSSGRMFWPVYYLIYVFVFCMAFKYFKPAYIKWILLVLLLVQMADMSKVVFHFREKFIAPAVWQPLKLSDVSPKNQALVQVLPYTNLVYVPPTSCPKNWIPWGDFAVVHHMVVNTGCFARFDEAKAGVLKQQLWQDLASGRLSKTTLYIFSTGNVSEEANMKSMVIHPLPEGYEWKKVQDQIVLGYGL